MPIKNVIPKQKRRTKHEVYLANFRDNKLKEHALNGKRFPKFNYDRGFFHKGFDRNE